MAFKASQFLRQKRWFPDNGLKFSCTQCGKCCRGRTNVFLNAAEANDIAGYLKINKFDFFKKYTEERETPDGVTTSLKSKKNVPECVFLSDKKCTIYEVRPTQCRTYPWWPSTLIGEAEWKAEAMRCEGIVLDAVGPAVETDYLDERLVPTKDILHNLVLHQVHGRGMGIEMNYKDASDSLIESENQSPGLIEEFEQDFFSTHFSRVLYEDDVVRVIETTIPAPDDDTGYTDPSHPHNTGIAKLNGGTTSTAAAVSLSSSASSPAAASGVHSTAEVNHIHMDEAIHHMQEESRSPSEQMKLQTFRRLEFNGSPHMTQTEVKMSVSSRRRKDDDAIRKVDYSQLLMPVHQVLAKLIKLELKSERPQPGGDHRPPSNSFLEVLGGAVSKVSPRTKKQHWWRFVVLGAGGCALPMHILQDKSVDPAFRITIDAVEPLDQVLYCAEMYFGAVWGNSGNEDTVRVLRPHNNNAFDYFRESSFSNYDIVVLDAFEDFTVERPAQQTAANSPISPNIVSDTTTVTLSSSGSVTAGNTESLQTRCSATEVQLRTRAPPMSLLEPSYLTLMLNAMNEAGLLMINIYGTLEWAKDVHRSIFQASVVLGFDRPILLKIVEPDARPMPPDIVLSTGPSAAGTVTGTESGTGSSSGGKSSGSSTTSTTPSSTSSSSSSPSSTSSSSSPPPAAATACPDGSCIDSNFVLVVSKLKYHTRGLANGVIKDGNCIIVDTK